LYFLVISFIHSVPSGLVIFIGGEHDSDGLKMRCEKKKIDLFDLVELVEKNKNNS